jgi:hypothetical protein
MKAKRNLTQEERYIFDYAQGARTALIESMRDCLIKALRIRNEEQGHILDKATIIKIKREIDVAWIGKVLNAVYNNHLSVAMFELHYDRLFLSADNPKGSSKLKDFDKHPVRGLKEIEGILYENYPT